MTEPRAGSTRQSWKGGHNAEPGYKGWAPSPKPQAEDIKIHQNFFPGAKSLVSRGLRLDSRPNAKPGSIGPALSLWQHLDTTICQKNIFMRAAGVEGWAWCSWSKAKSGANDSALKSNHQQTSQQSPQKSFLQGPSKQSAEQLKFQAKRQA